MKHEFLPYVLHLAAFLFCSGLYVVLVKKSSVFILVGIELMLNAANLALAAFSRSDPSLTGQLVAIFAITLTVCEVSIALAILLNIYRKMGSSNLEELKTLANE
ncbi:MAG: NADH-quinone oxidoreductase subunit NuoK [Bacteroidota bacterium]